MKALRKIAAASVFFVAVTASAQSDYALVVKATNKLIGLYESLRTDMNRLSKENRALHEEIKRLHQANGDMNNTYSEFVKTIEAEISKNDSTQLQDLRAGLEGVQVHLSGIEDKMARMSEVKEEPSMQTHNENVKAQEARLQQFLEPAQ